jgi:hypothetical protein
MNILERASQLAHGAKTLMEWLGEGHQTVPIVVAQERADVCLKCPMNNNTGNIAQAVATEIKKQIELKNHLNMRIVGEKSLLTCGGCGCALRLKIWLPDSRLKEDEEALKKYHQDCWIRKL